MTGLLAAASALDLAGLDLRVHLVWALPALALLFVRAHRKRRQALARYGLPGPEETPRRRAWQAALLLAALGCCYGALLRPRTDPVPRKVKAKVRDLAVCLDVSRSMLADDLAPNRLERAKLELARLADALEGDRIGLVVFAGDAVIQCPLTSNTSYFKSVLRNVTFESASQGGTRMGDAVRKALTDLLGLDLTGAVTEDGDAPALGPEALARHADVLLITDGEDQESYPVYAARAAGSLGVGLFAIGLGSETGHTIPIEENGRRSVLEYEGQPVLSKLDAKTLLEMVEAAGRGKLLPVATQNFDLVDFHRTHIRSAEGRELEQERLLWTEIYQPFALLGALLLVLSWSIPLRARGRRQALAAALVLAAALTPAPASVAWAADAAADEGGAAANEPAKADALSAAERFAKGNALYVEGEREAAAAVWEGGDATKTPPLHRFNAGVAKLDGGDLDAAITRFERASTDGTSELRHAALFNLGSAWLRKGYALQAAEPAPAEPDDPSAGPEAAEQAEAKRLVEAVAAYRRAAAFFLRVRPRTEAEERGAQLANLKARQALDRIRQLEEAARDREEAALLNEPPKLLRTVTDRVRERRRQLRALESSSRRAQRLPVRRLRRATADDRALLEKLRFGVESEAGGPTGPQPPAGGAPADAEQDAERRARLIAAIGGAEAGLREVEAALAGYKAPAAHAASGQAIERMLEARLYLPLDLGALVQEFEGEQRTVIARTRQAVVLPREQAEVGLVLGALTQLPDPPAPPEGAPEPGSPAPGHAPGQAPPMTKEVAAQIRDEAEQGLAAVQEAVAKLVAAEHAAAIPHEEDALARLEAIRDLLPKPPPDPAQRIRALITEERAVDAAVEGGAEVADDARAEQDRVLAERQEPNAAEATSIAEELRTLASAPSGPAAAAGAPPHGAGPHSAGAAPAGGGPDPAALEEAAGEVEQAREEISTSAADLLAARREPSREAIARAIEHLARALELLRPKGDQDQQDPQSKPQDQDPQDPNEDEGEQEPKGQQDARQLSPEEARRLMEELDRDREDVEKKLFRGSRGPAVEKDW